MFTHSHIGAKYTLYEVLSETWSSNKIRKQRTEQIMAKNPFNPFAVFVPKK